MGGKKKMLYSKTNSQSSRDQIRSLSSGGNCFQKVIKFWNKNIDYRRNFCSAKKKGVRMIVTLECTEARAEGLTPSRYTTQKNKKNTPQRLELMKYNPLLRKHTLHREVK